MLDRSGGKCERNRLRCARRREHIQRGISRRGTVYRHRRINHVRRVGFWRRGGRWGRGRDWGIDCQFICPRLPRIPEES